MHVRAPRPDHRFTSPPRNQLGVWGCSPPPPQIHTYNEGQPPPPSFLNERCLGVTAADEAPPLAPVHVDVCVFVDEQVTTEAEDGDVQKPHVWKQASPEVLLSSAVAVSQRTGRTHAHRQFGQTRTSLGTSLNVYLVKKRHLGAHGVFKQHIQQHDAQIYLFVS